MPEPTSTAVATLAAQAAAVPILTVFGVVTGLRGDLLLAGFCGSVAAMALLNTVPSTGDTLKELIRTSLKRVGVSIGSAVTAGYTASLVSFINGLDDGVIRSVAFVIGAGALSLLPWLIQRLGANKPDDRGGAPS